MSWLLVEGLGSDRGTYVVFRGSCSGQPWKYAGFHGKGLGFTLYVALARQVPRLWPWHVPRFCPWQPPGYPPWQPTELPRYIPWPSPHQLPRQSPVMNGECRSIPRQLSRQSSHGQCHGNTRQLPRHSMAISMAISTDINQPQFPRKAMAFRGHPRQLPRQLSHSTQIYAAIFQGGNLRQLPRLTTAFRGDYHGNFRGN